MDCLRTNTGLNPRYKLRFVLSLTAALCFLLYRFMYYAVTPDCLRDSWHDVTLGLNQRIANGSGADNVVIGIGQVLMDGWIFIIVILWIVKFRNGRIALAASLFFGLRYIILAIEAFPFPQHLDWHSPGFFSFTVPYDKTRDFFYSGHTGTLSVIMIQMFVVSYNWLGVAAFVSLFYMISMLTINRVHYTIDIAGGLFFAFFFHRMASKLVFYWDWILSLPYFLVKKGVQKYKSNKKQSTNLYTNPKGSNIGQKLIQQ